MTSESLDLLFAGERHPTAYGATSDTLNSAIGKLLAVAPEATAGHGGSHAAGDLADG